MDRTIKLGILLSLVVPLIIATLYFIFSRWPSRWFTTESDYFALGVSLIVGVVGITNLPWSTSRKFFSIILYIPIATAVIGFYGISFVCMAFGDCL